MTRTLQDTYLTVAQVRRIDQLAVERYRMPSIVLMENAARSALAAVTTFYPPETFARVVVLVGKGNNGGDGLAVARLLHNSGYDVKVLYAVEPEELGGDAAVNRDIVEAMGLAAERLVRARPGSKPEDEKELDLAQAGDAFGWANLAIDGLLGTGIKGSAREPVASLIEKLNDTPDLPVVALDVPSGFDADAGLPGEDGEGAAVIAELTVTFAANKVGYRADGASAYTGQVIVGSIGVPHELLDEISAQG